MPTPSQWTKWKAQVRQWSIWLFKVDPSTVEPNIEPLKQVGTITVPEVVSLMPKEFINPNNQSTYKTRVGVVSSEYYLTTKEEIQRFLTYNLVNKSGLSARVGRGNCKWYALALWGDSVQLSPGLCFGYISIFQPEAHAKNFAITLDNGVKNVWEIEPQSDHMKEMDVDGILMQRYEM